MMNMLLIKTVLALLLIRCLLAQDYGAQNKHFVKNLNHFLGESIHREELQVYMDSLDFNRKVTDGKYILDAMVSKFIKKYSQTVSAVKALEAAVHRSYQPSWLSPITNLFSTILGGRLSCKSASQNPNFTENVWSGTACEINSEIASYAATKLSEGFEKACQENIAKSPSLRWQYFSSNEGITTIFPSHRFSNPYDYRRRPWNLQAIKIAPKQVVVLIDNSMIEQPPSSFSMWNWNDKSIKSVLRAARSFTTKLNSQDQIALLYAFAEKTSEERCANCFRDNFVSSNPRNKQLVNNFINEIKPAEFSGYRQIILISQRKLDLHIPTHELKQLIIFKNKILRINVDFQLIDADVRDAQPQSLFDGTDSLVESADFLPMENNGDSPSLNPNDINDETSETSSTSTPSWSVVYADQWGLGPLVTASLPVFQDHRYVGVVAIDTPVHEFFDEPYLLMPNQYTYAFIVDDNGYVLNHPLLHHQRDVDTVHVSITTLERDPGFQTVYESIKRGESGKTEFYSQKFVSHVYGDASGNTKHEIWTTYYWEKVPNTKFTIGLAFVAESYIDISYLSSLPQGSFLYHRFDLSSPQTSCSHYNRFATMDKPTVYLAPRSFTENYKNEFNESDLMDLSSYFTSLGKQPSFLKDGVIEEMLTSHQAQIFWMNEENPFHNNIIWRHYTTLKGVFCIFPGIQLPEHYDPTTREWFTNTLTSTKEAVISTPYLDPASGHVVITIAQTIYKHSQYMTSSNVINPVAGVSGMDVKQEYFHKQFLNWFPSCLESHKRCYLLNQDGYVITTSADQKIYFDKHPLMKIHSKQVEPEVTHELINKKILHRNRCISKGKGCQETNYHIDDYFYEYESSLTLNQQLLHFYIAPVHKTNAFVLVISDSSPGYISHPCFCSVQNCTQVQVQNCNAMLAAGNNDFDCQEGNQFLSESIPCVPKLFPKVEIFENDWAHDLPLCYNTTFVHIELPPEDSIFAHVEIFLVILMACWFLFSVNRLRNRLLRLTAKGNPNLTTNDSKNGCEKYFDSNNSSEDNDKKYFEARSSFSHKKKSKKRKYSRANTEAIGSSDCEALGSKNADLTKTTEIDAAFRPALFSNSTKATLKDVLQAVDDICDTVEKRFKNFNPSSKPNTIVISDEKRTSENPHETSPDIKVKMQKIKPSKKIRAAPQTKLQIDDDKPCCSGLTAHLMEGDNEFVNPNILFHAHAGLRASFLTDTRHNVKQARESAEKEIVAEVMEKEPEQFAYGMTSENSSKRSTIEAEDEAQIQFWRDVRMRSYKNLPPGTWRNLPHSSELDFEESLESVPEEERFLITSFLTEQEQYDYMLFAMQDGNRESTGSSFEQKTTDKKVNVYDGLHSMSLDTIHRE